MTTPWDTLSDEQRTYIVACGVTSAEWNLAMSHLQADPAMTADRFNEAFKAVNELKTKRLAGNVPPPERWVPPNARPRGKR